MIEGLNTLWIRCGESKQRCIRCRELNRVLLTFSIYLEYIKFEQRTTENSREKQTSAKERPESTFSQKNNGLRTFSISHVQRTTASGAAAARRPQAGRGSPGWAGRRGLQAQGTRHQTTRHQHGTRQAAHGYNTHGQTRTHAARTHSCIKHVYIVFPPPSSYTITYASLQPTCTCLHV